jgi:hypothetical protein
MKKRTKIKAVRLYYEWYEIDGCQEMEKESKGCNSEGSTCWTIRSISHLRSRSNANPFRCSKKCFLFQRHTFLTLNLLTTTIVAPPSNASKWQMGFNSAFKGLTSAVEGDDWSASRQGRFTLEKHPGPYWVQDSVGSGGGLDIFWEDKYLLPLVWFEPWVFQIVA